MRYKIQYNEGAYDTSIHLIDVSEIIGSEEVEGQGLTIYPMFEGYFGSLRNCEYVF